jgi:hypothetical protein
MKMPRDMKIFTDDDMTRLEKAFGITFTAAERDLLSRSNALHTPIDSQHRYILLAWGLHPQRCGACGSRICERSATLAARDPEEPHPSTPGDSQRYPDTAYECPNCQAKLTWRVPLIGSPYFELTAGQVINHPLGQMA